MKESTRGNLIILAATMFWLATIANFGEILFEGPTPLDWVITVLFSILAIYYTLMAVTRPK